MEHPLLYQLTLNERQLHSFAAQLAPLLGAGDCVALHGDVGAGKTSLARAIIRARAGVKDMAVPSPTFTLVQSYELADVTFYHADLYRLKQPEALEELGFLEACASMVVLVEWPERAGRFLPADSLAVYLEHGQDAAFRQLILKGSPPWQQRLKSILTR